MNRKIQSALTRERKEVAKRPPTTAKKPTTKCATACKARRKTAKKAFQPDSANEACVKGLQAAGIKPHFRRRDRQEQAEPTNTTN